MEYRTAEHLKYTLQSPDIGPFNYSKVSHSLSLREGREEERLRGEREREREGDGERGERESGRESG